MKKLLLSLVILYSSSLYAQNINTLSEQNNSTLSSVTYKYQASEQNSTLSEVVKNWGAKENIIIYWDISADFNIDNFSEFNKKAHLEKAENLTQAVDLVLKFIKIERPKFDELRSCVYKESSTISIRPFKFPCD